jgi:hypothetical protein
LTYIVIKERRERVPAIIMNLTAYQRRGCTSVYIPREPRGTGLLAFRVYTYADHRAEFRHPDDCRHCARCYTRGAATGAPAI